ncbi:MAG: hypothetical protein IJ408_00535 [Clostridia bacterium]|nr:hypothetical protein [Clostridia bacterium]
MRRKISVFLLIILTLALCGCSNISIGHVFEKELVEPDVSALGDIVLLSVDSNERYTAMVYTDFLAGDSEEENRYYLSLFDLRKNSEIKRIELENGYEYKVELSTDGISLYSEADNEKISYDLKLQNPVKTDFEFEDHYETAKRIDTINTDRFACYDGYAISNNGGSKQALVFYDRPDTVYMLGTNVYYEYRYAYNHNMLVVDNSCNETENLESVIRLFDFDNLAEINSLTIPNNYDFNNVDKINFNAERVTVSTVNEVGALEKIYVWNYNLTAKNTPFEQDFCEATDTDALASKIDLACDRILEKYGVTVECAPEYEFIKEQFAIDNSVSLVEFYNSVLDLEGYFSLLPKEVYAEIICNDIKDPVSKFDDFRVYLVGDFPNDDIDGFASNMGCLETDNKHIVYIVYSCTGLNRMTFFHELMHTFEYRIWNYEKYFDENWMAYNPPSFEYSQDYAALYYDESHSEWQDYFARDYGMKDILEDRATCFEVLCDGKLTDNCWWKEKPHLLIKEQYLVKVLKKSFPSLNGSSLLNI